MYTRNNVGAKQIWKVTVRSKHNLRGEAAYSIIWLFWYHINLVLKEGLVDTISVCWSIKEIGLDIHDPHDHILIIYSACNQSMLGSSSRNFSSATFQYIHVDGVILGVQFTVLLQVKTVAILINSPYSGSKIITIINYILYIPDDAHFKSFLQSTNQTRSFEIDIWQLDSILFVHWW